MQDATTAARHILSSCGCQILHASLRAARPQQLAPERKQFATRRLATLLPAAVATHKRQPSSRTCCPSPLADSWAPASQARRLISGQAEPCSVVGKQRIGPRVAANPRLKFRQLVSSWSLALLLGWPSAEPGEGAPALSFGVTLVFSNRCSLCWPQASPILDRTTRTGELWFVEI